MLDEVTKWMDNFLKITFAKIMNKLKKRGVNIIIVSSMKSRGYSMVVAFNQINICYNLQIIINRIMPISYIFYLTYGWFITYDTTNKKWNEIKNILNKMDKLNYG